jgi:hypothetical protein
MLQYLYYNTILRGGYTLTKQKFSSANTSINSAKPPKLFRKLIAEATKGMRNFDVGGGKFDAGTDLLKEHGIKNLLLDPFNRSPEHNASVKAEIAKEKADTATIANVLNVVAEEAIRAAIIEEAAKGVKKGGKVYVWIYEGNKSGEGKQSKPDCWQENRTTESYVNEVSKFLKVVKVQRNLIIGEVL